MFSYTRTSLLTDSGVRRISGLIQLLEVEKIRLEVLGHMRTSDSPDPAGLIAPENVIKIC